MTFTDIVNSIASRLNLTEAASLARIGLSVNERYRRLASSVGLQTTARGTVQQTVTVGNVLVTFSGCEKLFSVYRSLYPSDPLDEVSVDELRNRVTKTGLPSQYAIYQMGATSVTVQLDATPTSPAYVLAADAELNLSTLSGTQVPNFAESFHDILIYGGMATELEKMEKYEMAQKQNVAYEGRLAELRYFIAKSAYLNRYQNKNAGTNGPRLLV